MAEPVGVLRALLSASSAVFEKDMKQARDSVRTNTSAMSASMTKFKTVANSALKSIFSMRTALVGLAGAGGLYLASKKAIAFADDIGKTAKAVGLTAEQLQELRFAADLAGLGAEDFDKAMAKLSKTVGDARRGSLPAALRLFQQMGIDIENLSNEQIFNKVANGFKDIEDSAVRMSFARELFGRSGDRMSDFLASGADQINNFRMQAQKLGVVISNDMVAKSEEANDKLAIMGQIIRVNITAALLDTIPTWSKMADTMSSPEFASAVRGAISLLSGLVDIVAALGKAIDAFSWDNIKRVHEAVYGGGQRGPITQAQPKNYQDVDPAKALAELFPQGASGNNGLGYDDDILGTEQAAKAAEKLKENIKQQQLHNQNLQLLVANYNELSGAVDDFALKLQLEEQAMQQNIDLNSAMGREWFNTEMAGRKLEKLHDDQKKVLEELRTPQDEYNDQVERLNQLLEAGAINLEQYKRAMENADEALKDGKRATDEWADTWDTLGDAAGSTLQSIWDKSKSAGDALKELARDMISIIAKKAIFDPIADTAGTFLSNIFGSLGNFGGARASGGPVYPGKTYLVGEKGPELFTPTAGGGITANDALGGGGGSGPIYNDFRGVDPSSITKIRAELQRMAGPGVVEKRVDDAIKRGRI